MVLALWVVAMLSTVAMMFAVAVRGRHHAEVFTWNEMEDMEAIRSLVLLANRQISFSSLERGSPEAVGLSLQSSQPTQLGDKTALALEGSIIPDGRTYTVQIEENRYRLSVEAEKGKIDINAVQEVVLHQLLAWLLGGSSREAQSLADGLLDWRDSDNLVRLYGAEDEAYKRAGKAYLPANRPFHSVDEMRLVLGMTSDVFHGLLKEEKGPRSREEWRGTLRDLFTVYSGSADIQLDYAPPPLKTFYQDMAMRGGEIPQAGRQEGVEPLPAQPTVAGQSTNQAQGGVPAQVVLLKVDTGHAAYRIWFPANEGQTPPEILRVEEDLYAMMEPHVQK